jgi:hypothetical protein
MELREARRSTRVVAAVERELGQAEPRACRQGRGRRCGCLVGPQALAASGAGWDWAERQRAGVAWSCASRGGAGSEVSLGRSVEVLVGWPGLGGCVRCGRGSSAGPAEDLQRGVERGRRLLARFGARGRRRAGQLDAEASRSGRRREQASRERRGRRVVARLACAC